MYLKREAKWVYPALLLLVSNIYLVSMAKAGPPDVEHDYVIFQDDFEDGRAEGWTMSIPPDAPAGSSCREQDGARAATGVPMSIQRLKALLGRWRGRAKTTF